MYDEYGEVIMEDDGYYYSPHGPEVIPFLKCEFHDDYPNNNNDYNNNYTLNRLCLQCIIETAVSTLRDISVFWLYHHKRLLN